VAEAEIAGEAVSRFRRGWRIFQRRPWHDARTVLEDAMESRSLRSIVMFMTCAVVSVLGLATPARADVCVTIDTTHDMFSPSEQAAARLLMERQFGQAGERVLPEGCESQYSLTHVRLGNTIVVSVDGPGGRREGIALGMDDLPALYNQMARSIVSGRPMEGFNVIDRTNVTESQSAAPRRVHTDSIWYARLGYGSLFGNESYGTPALGFGYRAEMDAFAIDVAFLNFQFGDMGGYSSRGATTQSLLKLSGLYFLSPTANRSAYFGGGLSYGHQNFGGSYNSTNGYYSSGFEGSGLQGELTAGYEFARVTTFRMFVQADAVLPFYEATSETYAIPSRTSTFPPAPTTSRRYAPSLIVSVGIGR
jgi:hypothetical protein